MTDFYASKMSYQMKRKVVSNPALSSFIDDNSSSYRENRDIVGLKQAAFQRLANT